ncbi:hypothetical protein C0J52_19580, partial [Blattella germanica]
SSLSSLSPSLIVLSIPSVQVIFGRLLFLLPIGCHSKIFFGNLSSLILFTCPNHHNCAVLISSIRDPFTFFSLITVILIFSLLEILVKRHQKSISVELRHI